MIQFFCPHHAPPGRVKIPNSGTEKATCAACGEYGYTAAPYAMFKVGDRVVYLHPSPKRRTYLRVGTVVDAQFAAGDEHYYVRWDEASEEARRFMWLPPTHLRHATYAKAAPP